MSPPDPETTVRLATAGDVPAIAALAGQLYALHHTWDPQRFWDLGGEDEAQRAGRERFFASQLAAADSELLLAECAGAIVGYAYVAYKSHDYEGLLERAAWLHDVYVVPAARGGDAAKRLFEAACERARAAACPLLLLTVAEPNARGRAFFARHGARVTMREMVVELTARTLPPC